MDYDAEEDRLLIWSDSNEIYEIASNGRCQCKAQQQNTICWHRTAKRIVERYNEAMAGNVHKGPDSMQYAARA